MCVSNLLNDSLFDRYIDSNVYEHSQSDTTLPSLEAGSFGASSYASPHYASHTPHTTAHHAPHSYSTALNSFGNETGPLYLVDQERYETELSTTFGSGHVEECSVEENMLEPYRALVSQDIDHDIHPFLRGHTSGKTRYDYDMNTNATDISCSGHNWDLDQDFASTPPSHLSHSREGKNKRFACPHCKQGFNLQHVRLRHMKTLHSRQENGVVYRCAVPGCAKWDKIWTRLDNFKKHLAKQHEAESIPELVQKSRTLGSGDAFTVTTPEMFSR